MTTEDPTPADQTPRAADSTVTGETANAADAARAAFRARVAATGHAVDNARSRPRHSRLHSTLACCGEHLSLT